MAKINLYIPEPQPVYTPDSIRQINQALETLQNQLNTSYQQDLREESQTFTTFMINTDPSKDRRLADFTEQAELFSWFLFGRERVKLKRD
jgi:hypothetical protein